MTKRTTAMLTLALAWASACGDSTTEDASAAESQEPGGAEEAVCDAPALVATRCASCHNAAAPAAGLDLASAGLPGRLEGVTASANCADHVPFDSTDPEQSLLYLKVTDAPPCGARMPMGGMLTEDEQLCILDWLVDG